jgi:hypothetical protein
LPNLLVSHRLPGAKFRIGYPARRYGNVAEPVASPQQAPEGKDHAILRVFDGLPVGSSRAADPETHDRDGQVPGLAKILPSMPFAGVGVFATSLDSAESRTRAASGFSSGGSGGRITVI